MNNTNFFVLSMIFFIVFFSGSMVAQPVAPATKWDYQAAPEHTQLVRTSSATPDESLRILNGQLANPLPCSGLDGSGCANTPTTSTALLPCSGPVGSGCTNTPQSSYTNPATPYPRNMTPAFSPAQTIQYYSQPIYVSRPVFYQVPQPTIVWKNVTPRPVPLASTSPNLTKLFAHLDKYQPKPETSIEPESEQIAALIPTPIPISTSVSTPTPKRKIVASRATAAVVVDIQPEQQPIVRRSRKVPFALGVGLLLILVPLFWQLYVQIHKMITSIKEGRHSHGSEQH